MWTEKPQRDVLFDKFLSTGLIKNKIDVDIEDKGWVSYIAKDRILDGDDIGHFCQKGSETGQPNITKILKETEGSNLEKLFWTKGYEDSFFSYWSIKEKIQDSYIMVVAESRVDYSWEEEPRVDYFWEEECAGWTGVEQYYPTIMTSTHFTEKTAWAILLKKPFFIYGGYGCLDALKNLGFRTFDKIFDESYQYELSLSKKVDMITNQLCELSKKDEKEVKTIIDSVESIVNHNQELLLKSINDRKNLIFKYFTRNIKDILKRD
jgi:hypothetical protein